MNSAAIPTAIVVAVDVPSLRMVPLVASYPGRCEKLSGQAPDTASPRALYFSSPSNGGLNVEGCPKPSADPMQKISNIRAGKVIGKLAPEFEQEAKTRILRLMASFRAAAIDGTSSRI